MSEATAKLPSYLKKYISKQDYARYTAQDHSAWRYIMRLNRAFFAEHAAPIYLEGLKRTGIPSDSIPRIEEMDACLSKFGWGAVAVSGFIPPAAFLDFQARGVLPIACEMRSVEHLAYTPAPDIVHEAAGHAPIIADPAYAKYLHHYAQMARKAIMSLHDIQMYEAIRYLSDIKENPQTPTSKVREAEEKIKALQNATSEVSENTKVTRMNWWTVEYGLVGSLKNPKIYGAGLLSSIGESQACLSPKIRKVPLSIECVETGYDITEPQPLLFVTPNLEYLTEVLDSLESTLAFRVGGAYGLMQAQKAKTVTTVELNTGLQISGVLDSFAVDAQGKIEFFKFSGPTQLSYENEQLPGHGTEYHSMGYSSPLGTIKNNSPQDIAKKIGSKIDVEFFSGITLEGFLTQVLEKNGQLLLFTFKECTVRQGSNILFAPDWGTFDCAIGIEVTSVFGGPASRESFGELSVGEAATIQKNLHTVTQQKVFEYYQKLRELRLTPGKFLESETRKTLEECLSLFPQEWLLHFEAWEIASGSLKKKIEEHLNHSSWPEPQKSLILKGFAS